MDNWDEEYVDLVEPGFIAFGADNIGEFVFGVVRAVVDYRVSHREPYIAFSWEGDAEGDRCSGRGWFEFPTPDQGEGMLFIHCGDESGIEIERET